MVNLDKKSLLTSAGVTASFSANGKHDLKLTDYLAQSLQSKLENNQSGQRLVCIDYDSRVKRRVAQQGIGINHRFLIRTEPSVVLPSNFSRSTQNLFGQVVTLGGDPSAGTDCIPWPQVWPKEEDQLPGGILTRHDKIVSVSGNKLSLIPGELYLLRRKCIQQLQDLDLFGKDWASAFHKRLETAFKAFVFTLFSGRVPKLSSMVGWFSRYPKWLGEVADKRKVMSNYKYALVIENSTEYMSEKLFDAFFAGCIPIYVGPKVANYGIPEELVIQAEPNLKSIQLAYESAKRANYDDWFRRMNRYLDLDSTRAKWSHENVYQEIANRLL